MPFDFKKEYKEFYLPKQVPQIVDVPRMNYVAVRGQGDPNETDGAYQQALGVLYAIAYTIRMSGKGGHRIEGFFEYVVPPLEGFWRQEGTDGVDYANKAGFRWISAIRLPDFVAGSDLEWAAAEAERKKKIDCSQAEFLTMQEGIWGPTTANRSPLCGWTNIWRKTDFGTICQKPACTMRFISPTPAEMRRKSGKPLFAIRLKRYEHKNRSLVP